MTVSVVKVQGVHRDGVPRSDRSVRARLPGAPDAAGRSLDRRGLLGPGAAGLLTGTLAACGSKDTP